MRLEPALGQSIVDRMMQTIPYNINIMNEHGYIIASGDKSRINTLHVGSLDSIKSGQTLPMLHSHGNHGQPGVNMPVKFKKKIIGVVGITGDPNTVTRLASLLKVATELLISQSYNNQMREKHKNRLNRFLYQWLEVTDDIKNHPDLVSEAASLQINIDIKRFVIVIENHHHSHIKYNENDFVISISPSKIIVITSQQNLMQNYLQQCLNHELKIGISNKTTRIGTGLKQAENTVQINKIFKLNKSPYYKNVRFIDKLLSTKDIADPDILDLFTSLNKTDNGHELIQTLDEYFNCSGSVSETSKHLHIHRNTTNYRLNKISEFFNLDIHNFNDIFELYINYLTFKNVDFKHKMNP